MWDVIDNETVRRLALLFKHRKPADLALHLARKAVRRRIKFSMRGDDITGQGCRRKVFSGSSVVVSDILRKFIRSLYLSAYVDNSKRHSI